MHYSNYTSLSIHIDTVTIGITISV